MPSKPEETVEALLLEKRRFKPPKGFVAQANVSSASLYGKAERDFKRLWAGFAGELDWFKPWRKVLNRKPPRAKWFVGGRLNASVHGVHRHLAGPRRNEAAVVWEGEPGDRRPLTYRDSSLHTAGVPPYFSSGATRRLQVWREFGGSSRSGTPGVGLLSPMEAPS
jgi:hypothetical protein